MFEYKIELNSFNDIKRFTDNMNKVNGEVRLKGYDEHGHPWDLSAKSLLCSVVVAASRQKNRDHTAHNVDWNTLVCVSDSDIYSLVKDFVTENHITE